MPILFWKTSQLHVNIPVKMPFHISVLIDTSILRALVGRGLLFSLNIVNINVKLENTSELGSGQCPPAPPPDQLEIRNIDTDQLTSWPADQLTSWPADAGQHTAAAAGHGGITIRRGSAGPRTLGRSPPTSTSWTRCTESASILELSWNLRK